MKSNPDPEIRASLACNLIRLRRERSLTQEKLASISELDRSLIGDVERRGRNVSLDTLGKIARALNVKPMELLRDE